MCKIYIVCFNVFLCVEMSDTLRHQDNIRVEERAKN